MTATQQLSSSQSSPEVPINENFETLSVAAIFGKRQPATSALTWGYYGGLFGGNSVADGVVTLTDGSDNYVVVERSTGTVSCSTTSANSLSTSYAKLYKVTTASGAVSVVVDQRMDANGLFAGATSPAGGDPVNALTVSSGVVNIDLSLGRLFTLAPTADVTSMTYSNKPGSGQGFAVLIEFTQDTTARAVAFPTGTIKLSGAAVSTGSGAKDLIGLTSMDNGTATMLLIANGLA